VIDYLRNRHSPGSRQAAKFSSTPKYGCSVKARAYHVDTSSRSPSWTDRISGGKRRGRCLVRSAVFEHEFEQKDRMRRRPGNCQGM